MASGIGICHYSDGGYVCMCRDGLKENRRVEDFIAAGGHGGGSWLEAQRIVFLPSHDARVI